VLPQEIRNDAAAGNGKLSARMLDTFPKQEPVEVAIQAGKQN
jgi:hypothetical protein